jgi:hypothetical protein
LYATTDENTVKGFGKLVSKNGDWF